MLPSSPPFILVIESSLTLRTIIHTVFRRAPCPVRWALYENALAALRDIHAGALPIPDGALIRMHLRGLDGLEAVRIMRAQGYPTKIVLLLEQDRRIDRVKARLCGANAVLVKPFKVQDLERFLALFTIYPDGYIAAFQKGPSPW